MIYSWVVAGGRPSPPNRELMLYWRSFVKVPEWFKKTGNGSSQTSGRLNHLLTEWKSNGCLLWRLRKLRWGVPQRNGVPKRFRSLYTGLSTRLLLLLGFPIRGGIQLAGQLPARWLYVWDMFWYCQSWKKNQVGVCQYVNWHILYKKNLAPWVPIFFVFGDTSHLFCLYTYYNAWEHGIKLACATF